MRPSFAVFFLLMLVVIGAANYYAYRWAGRAFHLSRPKRLSLGWVLGLSLAGMVLGRFLDGLTPALPAGPLSFVASTIQLAVVISVALLLVVELVTFLVARAQTLGARPTAAVSPASPALPVETAPSAAAPSPLIPRRTLLTQAAVGSAFLIGGSSSLYGTLVGRHDYSLEDVPFRIPGLSKALDGFTIVQLSDIHIGAFVGDAELNAGLDLVRRARPDLIVLTGDLLDHDARLAERLGRFVRQLTPLAREGVVAITGNHDFYAGVEPTVAALHAAGARVLRNAGEVIGGAQGFSLLGVDDIWAKRFDPTAGPDLERAVRSLPLVNGRHIARDLPRVLLCHNPSYFEHAAGEVALQLSGHTHGGQVNLVVRPADAFLKNGWVAGHYERSGSSLYINRGFGTAGPPARIGSPPEITRAVLVA
jgi:predicted MPP superfamily phosphohydrolase